MALVGVYVRSTVFHRDRGSHTSKDGSSANERSNEGDHLCQKIKDREQKKPSRWTKKMSADIPPRECEACTLSKRVICMGHLLVRKSQEKKKKIKQTSRKWRKDRLSRINSTKKRQGRNEGKRKRGKMGKSWIEVRR